MSQQVAGAGAAPQRPAPAAGRNSPVVLICGVLAGPLFIVVTAIEVVTRDGFDLRRNGLSQLSLGDRGWIQIVNFIAAGILSITFATGVRRVLRPGVGAVSAPVLICGYGVGLIATGVFLVDPGAGFPPGTPDGLPDRLSWHGAVHAIAPPVAFVLLVAVCFVFARRLAGQHRWGWAAYCVLTGLVALVLVFWPGSGGSVRAAVAVLITSAWMTAIALMLLADRRTSWSRRRHSRSPRERGRPA